MSVVKIMCAGKVHQDPKRAQEIPGPIRQLLAKAMIINSSFKSDVELDEAGNIKKYAGNDTECAMLYIADLLIKQVFACFV